MTGRDYRDISVEILFNPISHWNKELIYYTAYVGALTVKGRIISTHVGQKLLVNMSGDLTLDQSGPVDRENIKTSTSLSEPLNTTTSLCLRVGTDLLKMCK